MEAGGDDEFSNGNGSLMRILPASLRFASEPLESRLQKIHIVSALTHRHVRSQMACGFHALCTAHLLMGHPLQDAIAFAASEFLDFDDREPYGVDMLHVQPMLEEDLGGRCGVG